MDDYVKMRRRQRVQQLVALTGLMRKRHSEGYLREELAKLSDVPGGRLSLTEIDGIIELAKPSLI